MLQFYFAIHTWQTEVKLAAGGNDLLSTFEVLLLVTSQGGSVIPSFEALSTPFKYASADITPRATT